MSNARQTALRLKLSLPHTELFELADAGLAATANALRIFKKKNFTSTRANDLKTEFAELRDANSVFKALRLNPIKLNRRI